MDSQTAGFVTCLLCGLLVAATGVYMLVTGNPRIMHGYHFASTPIEKWPALARWSGAGLAACGVGCALLVPMSPLPDWLSIVGIVLMVAGLALTLGAVVHFNGSLFSFGALGSGASDSSAPHTLTTGLGIVIALIVCGVTVIPGSMMIASGDPSMLHGYHLVNVAADDLPALAGWVGGGTIALGVGLALSILVGFLMSGRRPAPLWTKVLMGAGLVLFGIGLAVTLGAITHYNGSLMG